MPIQDVSNRSIAELVSLSGRVAVVTGAARGLGAAIASRLAEAGASVVIGDVDDAGAKDAAQALQAAGRTAIGAALDARDEASVRALADRAVDEYGSVDIWVNNAGIYPGAPLIEMPTALWDDILDLNLKGTFLGAREAATRMIAAGRGGVIVNLSSTAGYHASGPGITGYVSSKFGVRGLTAALAVELGPHGIRVLAVAPTFIDTPGTRVGRDRLEAAGQGDFLEQRAASKPLGRMGVPDDVARVVLFCASDLAVLMTGATIPVDAGELVS